MINDPDLSRQELDRALRETPAYRRWQARDPGPDAPIDDRYAALPVTSRRELQAGAPRAFLPVSCDLDGALLRGEAELVRGVDPDGGRATLAWSQAWWNASERAGWAAHPRLAALASAGARRVVLGTPRSGPVALGPSGDPGLWTRDDVRRVRDELEALAPAVLESEAGHLAGLCARAEALGLRLPAPEAVLLTGRRPSRLHRSRIARAIDAPIVTALATPATGYGFVSCELGSLHQNVRSCRVELARWGGDPALGRLVITPFGHPWMCLVRLDLGDLVRLAPRPCPCGRREGLTLADVEGPLDEATVATDGGLVTPAAVDDVVWSSPPGSQIVSYRLEQPRPGELLLRLTAAARGINTDPLAVRLRTLHGPGTEIRIEVVESLARGTQPLVFHRDWAARFEAARAVEATGDPN